MDEVSKVYYKKLASNLVKHRKKIGITRSEAARMLGVNEPILNKYEAGTVRVPVDRLFKLSIIYKISLATFFIGVEDNLQYNDLPKELVRKINPLLKELEEIIKRKITHDKKKKR